MSYVENMTDLGDKVMGRVTAAIEQEDFSGLAEGIRLDFQDFAKDMKSQGFGLGSLKDKPKFDINDLDHSGSQGTAQAGAGQNQSRDRKPTYQTKKKPKYGRPFAGEVPFMMKSPSKGGNVALSVIGLFGMLAVMGAVPSVFHTPLDQLASASGVLWTVLRIVPLAVFLVLFVTGLSGMRLTDSFYKYASIIGREEYIDIKDLAEHAGESQREVLKKLRRMIKRRMIPHATFDDKEKTLILSARVYKQYEEAKASNARANKKRADQEKQAAAADPETAARVKNVMAEGESFLADLTNAQARIKDPDMCLKLAQMEKVVRRIFERVQDEPSNVRALRRFMNQYLPTTRKLISAYIKVENQPMAGENITDTKKEIAGAMDTINQAFVVLLDSLYRDVAWDVSSDISAMKSMFEQDGLIDDRKRQPEEE